MSNDIMNRSAFSNSELAINDFQLNTVTGKFNAVLEHKAWGGSKILRLFFAFDDGRQIIAPVYPWQRYLGFCEMPLGSKVRLTYTQTHRGTYLTEAEQL